VVKTQKQTKIEVCYRCKSTVPFTCGLCRTEIRGQSIQCHKRIEHQGRYFPLAVECPHCGELTKAPSNVQIRVYFLSEVFCLSNAKIIERLPFLVEDSIRSIKRAVPRLCNHCQERIIPSPKMLKVLLFRTGAFVPRIYESRAGAILSDTSRPKMTLEETARFFDTTIHQVRAVCAECTGTYGKTVYRMMTQGKRFNCAGKGNHAQARYSKDGYSRQRGDRDGEK